jgi:hypothetical protein
MLMSERVEQAFRPAVKLLKRYRLQPLRYGLTFSLNRRRVPQWLKPISATPLRQA